MSKLLFSFFIITFAVWYYHFDPAAYHERQQQIQMAETSTPVSVDVPESVENELGESESGEIPLFPLKNMDLNDVISGYGDKRAGGKRRHEGIDIPAPKGTPVLAITDGTVSKVANKGNGGKQVWLKSEDGKYTFFYAHLDAFTVAEGQLIKRGTPVGTVGNTGNARHTLPHLHLGVYTGSRKTIDPTLLFSKP